MRKGQSNYGRGDATEDAGFAGLDYGHATEGNVAALRYDRSIEAPGSTAVRRAGPVSPTSTQEVSFINGLNPDGTLTDTSYWGSDGQTAFKWGEATLGTGATITYSFDAGSRFSVIEKQTFLKAFEMWEAVADVTFVEVANSASAGLVLKRGNDDGAYTSTPTSDGRGRIPGSVTGQALISIDTSVPGFDLSGSFDRGAGYGMSTIIHEVGHLLGLGHGGAYNGDVNARTDQFSAYDDRMFSIMSYISWYNTDAKFARQNPVQGTYWGESADGSIRNAPHSLMVLDIVAIQQIYGVSQSTPFDGGQTYGFHSNIEGVLGDFYDFSANSSPVLTIYNQGIGNTIDLSEYAMNQYIDLRPGVFSSVGGLVNNLTIAFGTQIDTAIGGSGSDTLVANDLYGTLRGGSGADSVYGGAGGDILFGDGGNDWLIGNFGRDTMTGGSGADTFWFVDVKDTNKTAASADVITDFDRLDGDIINLTAIDAVRGGADNAFRFTGTAAFTRTAGELHYQAVAGGVLVTGDINGDAKADFAFKIEDVSVLVASDFVL